MTEINHNPFFNFPQFLKIPKKLENFFSYFFSVIFMIKKNSAKMTEIANKG